MRAEDYWLKVSITTSVSCVAEDHQLNAGLHTITVLAASVFPWVHGYKRLGPLNGTLRYKNTLPSATRGFRQTARVPLSSGVCFQTEVCFDLCLNADLILFTHRRRPKDVLELGKLLLEVATGLARFHVGFCLPKGY